MAILSEWMNRLRYLGRRSRIDDNLEAEVRFHIESRTADLIASGASPRDAAARARAEFGSIARALEDSRAAWQFRWIEDLAGDLRYGFRTIRRSPGFAVTAVLSLALGIGANAAIFNALHTVLWKPLPVSKPEELVKLSISLAKSGQRDVPPIAFVGQLQSAGVFEGLSVASADGFSFAYDGRAERVLGEVVSGNYFDLLGVRSVVGQPFTPEVRSGRWAAEAVLSHGFWQRRFGGDPGVIGRTIRLNTYPFIIAGVSPPGFHGLDQSVAGPRAFREWQSAWPQHPVDARQERPSVRDCRRGQRLALLRDPWRSATRRLVHLPGRGTVHALAVRPQQPRE